MGFRDFANLLGRRFPGALIVACAASKVGWYQNFCGDRADGHRGHSLSRSLSNFCSLLADILHKLNSLREYARDRHLQA